MCGIAGILKVWTPDQRELALRTPHGQSIPEAWLDILDDSIKHRGPDGQGRFRDRAIRADGCVVDVALVHRRLSIIDHAGGHQPMVLRFPKRAPSASSGVSSSNEPEAQARSGSRPIPGRLLSVEDLTAHNRRIEAEGHAATNAAEPELALGAPSSHDHIAVVFNGCIYNHRELRAELQRAGHVFNTDHSDTEVLVHGWREWEAGLFDRLEGMWAWVLWDSATARLLFTRDPAGEKILFVSPSQNRDAGVVILGSTAAGVIRLRAQISGEVPAVATASTLLWGSDDHGPCDDVKICTPDSLCVFDSESGTSSQDWLREPQGWPTPRPNGSQTGSFDADHVDRMLAASVGARCEADVPLACFLSGGLDSPLIAAHVRRAMGQVRTFTVRMPDPRFDESETAARIAKILGTEHETIDCLQTPADDLVRLITQIGHPLGDSSLLPTHWVSRAVASRGIRVVLSGDGGDELFGGYERYQAARWLSHWSWFFALLPGGLLSQGDPKARSTKLARLIRGARSDGYPDLLRLFSKDEVVRLELGDDRENDASRHSTMEVHDWQGDGDPRRFDFRHYLPTVLCPKVDTASMACPLEVRAPMLSRDLTREALSQPLSVVMPHNQRKGLLRAVARKYLPAEIVDRPKMGFAIPIGEWFRSDYGGMRTMLLDHLNSTEPFGPPSLGIDLNMKFIRQMLDEHLGTGPSGVVKRDHSQRLYMLLVLSIWAKWLGGLRTGH